MDGGDEYRSRMKKHNRVVGRGRTSRGKIEQVINYHLANT